MKPNESRARYQSPLREEQKNQTRDLILDAAERLLRRANMQRMTMAGVARAAQVTERTVYRHFPTRDDLIAACWRRVLRVFMRGQGRYEVNTLEQMLDLTREAFRTYTKHEGVVRALVESPGGNEVRKASGQRIHEALKRTVEKILPGYPPDTIQTIATAVFTIASTPAWAHLRFQCDLPGEDAGEIAVRTVAWMVEGARIQAKNSEKSGPKAAKGRRGR